MAAFSGFLILQLAPTGPAINIPQSALKHELGRKLPIRKDAGPVTANIQDAILDLLEDGNIRIRVAADVEGPGISTTSLADIKAKISYEEGQVWIADISLDDVQISESPIKIETGDLNNETWNSYLDDMSIDDEASAFFLLKRKLLLDSIPGLQANIQERLSRRPALDLSDRGIKGQLAQALIGDLNVKQGTLEVIIRLSNWITHSLLLSLTFIMFLLHRGVINIRIF